jgi:putative nucleotidyltransferase with HDIG domain
LIQQINSALVEMQSALLARALYPREHPRIVDGEERALAQLDSVLTLIPELTLFAVDNRVIFRNEVLPSSAHLAETLFRSLHDCGVDRVTLLQGFGKQELRGLLDDLSTSTRQEGTVLGDSAHVRFGSLADIDIKLNSLDLAVDRSTVAHMGHAASALSGVWQGIDSDPRANLGVLEDIVSSLSKVVIESAGAMLPLAPLKQHDEYTFVHTINVAMLSTSLGEVLGFDRKLIHDLNTAALLHDVGKRSIPHSILNKAGKFTDEEFQVMKAHPVEGARILFNTPHVPELAPIVAFEHHVRADGSGYPRVPRGWKLSLSSRIVQIADVFDALRTDRPYRPGLSVPKIIEIMRRDVGTFFDADLLLIFLQEVIARGVPSGKQR